MISVLDASAAIEVGLKKEKDSIITKRQKNRRFRVGD